jgi:hypothetical protein
MASYYQSAQSGAYNGRFTPGDHGLLAWNYDPVYHSGSAGSLLGTAGTIYVMKLHVPACSVTNVIMYCTTAGNTLTSGQNFAGLYQGGALIGATADQTTAWGSGGLKTMALASGPFTIAAGDAYIAAFSNGSTVPQFARTSNLSALINAGITATASNFGSADTGRTSTFPATLGTISAAGNAFWAALS